MGALTAGELKSENVLIQLLRGFGCTYGRRAYIRECAYTTSDEFWVHLQPESLHLSVLLPSIKGIHFYEPKEDNCRCFQFSGFNILYAQVREQKRRAQRSLYEASLRDLFKSDFVRQILITVVHF